MKRSSETKKAMMMVTIQYRYLDFWNMAKKLTYPQYILYFQE